MWHLFHYTLCAYSRKIRLLLVEKSVDFQLVHEKPWERREAFWAMNPAAQTPVLHDMDTGFTLSDAGAIAEYIEETAADPPLVGTDPEERAETRRLAAWFDQKFHAEVNEYLFQEKVWKRFIEKSQANTAALRAAHYNLRTHLEYIAYLTDRRRWLAGDRFSLADIAAAAHLSVADYLGGVDWSQNAEARDWYMRVKSRPAFRPLLTDRISGLAPPKHYEKIDF
ncbi:MAG: glutathione S-transferase family protein [Pseudomonadota bacterium]